MSFNISTYFKEDPINNTIMKLKGLMIGENIDESTIIRNFVWYYGNDHFHKITNLINKYDVNDMFLKGIDKQSIYVLITNHINSDSMDIAYMALDKDNIYFVRPTDCVGVNRIFELILEYTNQKEIFEKDYEYSYITHRTIGLYLNNNDNNISSSNIKNINIMMDDKMWINAYKINPELLYTEHNINLIKVHSITSL